MRNHRFQCSLVSLKVFFFFTLFLFCAFFEFWLIFFLIARNFRPQNFVKSLQLILHLVTGVFCLCRTKTRQNASMNKNEEPIYKRRECIIVWLLPYTNKWALRSTLQYLRRLVWAKPPSTGVKMHNVSLHFCAILLYRKHLRSSHESIEPFLQSFDSFFWRLCFHYLFSSLQILHFAHFWGYLKCNITFKSGDSTQYSMARGNLKKGLLRRCTDGN